MTAPNHARSRSQAPKSEDTKPDGRGERSEPPACRRPAWRRPECGLDAGGRARHPPLVHEPCQFSGRGPPQPGMRSTRPHLGISHPPHRPGRQPPTDARPAADIADMSTQSPITHLAARPDPRRHAERPSLEHLRAHGRRLDPVVQGRARPAISIADLEAYAAAAVAATPPAPRRSPRRSA